MNDERSFEDRLHFFTIPLAAISLVLGVAGFLSAGEGFFNALFNTLQMFVMNYGESPANICIGIARFAAPLSVATGILSLIGPLMRRLRDKRYSAFGFKGTVIYSDTSDGKALCKDIRSNTGSGKVILYEKPLDTVRATRTVIMMGSDAKSLELFSKVREKNRKTGKDSSIYLCLYDMEPNLIPSFGEVNIFNIYDVVSGCFWHKNAPLAQEFLECPDREYHIVLLGFEALGQRLLYKGLLLNLFSTGQRIAYHIYDISGKPSLPIDTGMYETMNGDSVLFHAGWPEEQALQQADMVLLTEDITAGNIQKLLYGTTKAKVFYYAPDGVYIEEKLQARSNEYARLSGFGNRYPIGADGTKTKQIISEKMILNNGLNTKARALHEEYTRRNDPKNAHRSKSWNELDGFSKGANINAVDYAETGCELLRSGKISEEALAKLEHIRWCRYHFLNHWKYGETAEGSKDRKLRLHKCLIPFEELPEEYKENDRANVRKWNECV